MERPNLMLVDGDVRSLRVLEVALRKAGFNVIALTSGTEALSAINSASPDLIISDTRLAGIDGFELCRRLKTQEQWKSLPFIFLTNETSIEDKIKGLELGVEEYLTKPIYIKEILTRARMQLQKHQHRRMTSERQRHTTFQGALTDLGVVDLFQTIEVSRKSGVIHLRSTEGREGSVFFRDGTVIDAECGRLGGEDAIFRLLTWVDGQFEVHFQTVRREARISMSTQAILMEGMRRLDEWQNLVEQLPALDTVCGVEVGSLHDHLSDIPDVCNPILRLLNEQTTLLEVLDDSPYDDIETLRLLAKLYFDGVVIEVTKPHVDDTSGLLAANMFAQEQSSGPVATPVTMPPLEEPQVDSPLALVSLPFTEINPKKQKKKKKKRKARSTQPGSPALANGAASEAGVSSTRRPRSTLRPEPKLGRRRSETLSPKKSKGGTLPPAQKLLSPPAQNGTATSTKQTTLPPEAPLPTTPSATGQPTNTLPPDTLPASASTGQMSQSSRQPRETLQDPAPYGSQAGGPIYSGGTDSAQVSGEVPDASAQPAPVVVKPTRPVPRRRESALTQDDLEAILPEVSLDDLGTAELAAQADRHDAWQEDAATTTKRDEQDALQSAWDEESDQTVKSDDLEDEELTMVKATKQPTVDNFEGDDAVTSAATNDFYSDFDEPKVTEVVPTWRDFESQRKSDTAPTPEPSVVAEHAAAVQGAFEDVLEESANHQTADKDYPVTAVANLRSRRPGSTLTVAPTKRSWPYYVGAAMILLPLVMFILVKVGGDDKPSAVVVAGSSSAVSTSAAASGVSSAASSSQGTSATVASSASTQASSQASETSSEDVDPKKEARSFYRQASRRFGRGALKDALESIEKSIELDKRTSSMLLKSKIQQDMGDLRDALSTIEEILDRRPQNADAWARKGAVLRRLGKSSESRQAYRKFLTLEPDSSRARQIRAMLDRGQ